MARNRNTDSNARQAFDRELNKNGGQVSAKGAKLWAQVNKETAASDAKLRSKVVGWSDKD